MKDIVRKGGILLLAVVVIDLLSWQLGLIHNLTELLLVSTTAAVGVATVLTIFLPSGKTLVIKEPLTPPEQPNLPPVRIDLPPRPDPFRGRVDELAELLAALQPGKIVSICAPGGMGKTALSGEALWRLSAGGTQPPAAFPDGVFFHTFYNQKSVEAAFEALARFFGEEPKPTPEAAARRALSGKRALLILDGAEDADRLERMLAIHGACGVLITTRDRAQIQGAAIELHALDEDAALQLLKDSAGEYASAEAEAKRICELLGYLPLALNLAGRYMCAHQQKAAEYLVFLEKTPLAVLHLDERRHESARVLFERSLEALEAGAAQILALFGQLAYAPLEEAWLGAVFADEAGLRRGLDALTRYGLLQRSGTSSQLAHALLHTYARELTPPEGALRALAGRWADYVEEKTSLGAEGFERLEPLRPHLRATLEGLNEDESWEAFFGLAYPMQGYLNIHGYTSEWRELCELALATARRAENRREQSAWLNSLGLACADLGELRKAIEYYQQALAVACQIGDRGMEGAVLGNLGEVYRNLGELPKAIEYYEQALAIDRQTGDQRMEGNQLGNLGVAYKNLGEPRKAIEYYEQALAIDRQIGDVRGEGADLGNLGIAYKDLGELPKAIEYYEQSLAIDRQIGDRRGEGNHLNNLWVAYFNLGEYAKAIEYYKQAVRIFAVILPPNHPYVQNTSIYIVKACSKLVWSMFQRLKQRITDFWPGLH